MPIEFKEEHFLNGYWYYRPEKNFPPPGCSSPEEHSYGDRLNIVDISSIHPKERSKNIKRWIKALPVMHDIQILWVNGQTPQILFDAICEMQGLEALYIKWSSIKSLDRIVQLQNLKSLHIGSSTRIESITPIVQLRQLQWLELENIKKIQDISPIGECTQLLGLSLDGSIWTTQKVETLTPLANLTELRHLSITNLRAMDKTLKPIFNLHKLQGFYSASWWNPKEFEEIEKRNPDLKNKLNYKTNIIELISKLIQENDS